MSWNKWIEGIAIAAVIIMLGQQVDRSHADHTIEKTTPKVEQPRA